MHEFQGGLRRPGKSSLEPRWPEAGSMKVVKACLAGL